MATSDPASSVARRYDEVAELYTELFHDDLRKQPIDEVLVEELVRRTIAHGEGQGEGDTAPLVADLGCGPGHVTTFLRSLGVDAVGLDVSARMVSIARRRSPANPVIQGSMAALPWPPASLDGALIRYSMIHAAVDEMPHLLAEVARGLRPGGHLLLFFLGVEDVEEDGRSYEHRVATAHLRHPSVVDRHLGEVGLTPVAWWRQGPGPTRPFSPCATMAVRATVATPDEPAAVAQ